MTRHTKNHGRKALPDFAQPDDRELKRELRDHFAEQLEEAFAARTDRPLNMNVTNWLIVIFCGIALAGTTLPLYFN